MSFKEFINLIEQGTKATASGLGAGGRAGQSQATPETGVGNIPNQNDLKNKKVPPSSFNVSDKGKTHGVRPASPHGPGTKALPNPPVSPFSFDMKQPQPTRSPVEKNQPVPSPIR